MQHDAATQTGANIRGAGGEVAEAVVVGVRDAGFDEIIQFVGLLPGGGEIEPTLEDLDSEVVLFVDHHAGLLALVDEDGAGTLGIRMFATDELTFDQELPVDRFKGTHIDVDELTGELPLRMKFLNAATKDLADFGTVSIGRA